TDAAQASSNIRSVVRLIKGGGRDVVVADDLAIAAHLVQGHAGRPADGMMIDHHIVAAFKEFTIGAERADLFAEILVAAAGIGVGFMAAAAQPAAHAEHVAGNGVARNDAGREKMDAAHVTSVRRPHKLDSFADRRARWRWFARWERAGA